MAVKTTKEQGSRTEDNTWINFLKIVFEKKTGKQERVSEVRRVEEETISVELTVTFSNSNWNYET